MSCLWCFVLQVYPPWWNIILRSDILTLSYRLRIYVYVMEFKLDGSVKDAMRQIEEKQYALPFAGDSRKVYRIGVNFSSETSNIER